MLKKHNFGLAFFSKAPHMYFRGPLCKHTPGCTGGTCGITGTWAPLGCSGLLCATPGRPVVQTHTWMYWGHMWHPWHLWHPWGPQGMQLYTYTCGWAHELPEKVHEDGFSNVSRAEGIPSREPHRRASQPAIQPASHPASQAASQPAIQPARQPASQPATQEMGWRTCGCAQQPASHPASQRD